MRRFLALCLAVLLCGCGGREQTTPGVSGAGEESRTTSRAEAAGSIGLVEAANCNDIKSVEKAIQAIKHRDDGVARLIQALRDENHFVQLAAATALSESGSKAVPDVTHLLSERDDNVRTWAIAILGAIGKPASTAVPLLKTTLDDRQPKIAELAATALAQIGGREATDIFVASITHPDKKIRGQALSFLESAKAKVAVPALITALGDKDADIRRNPAIGLFARYTSPEVAAAVPGLREALHDSNTEVRWWSAHALGAFKEKSKAAIPQLIETLKDKDESVRGQAIEALGNIGPEQGVVQALIGMLQDSNPHVRAATAGSLGNLGPAASAAIPALEKLRGGPDEFVTHAVDDAIAKLSGKRE